MSNIGWFECAEVRGVPDIWTPARIPTVLWLDARDQQTFTLNGNKVVQWNSKSGDGYALTQPTDALRPILSDNKVVFTGSHWLQNTAIKLPLTAFTFVAVYKENVAVANAGLFSIRGSGNDYASTDGLIIGPSNKTTVRFACTGSASSNFAVQDTVTPSVACALGIYTVRKDATSGMLRIDGNVKQQDTVFTAFSAESLGGVVIGARQTPSITSPYLNGEVMEIIYTTQDNVTQLEGYLAWKWGLV